MLDSNICPRCVAMLLNLMSDGIFTKSEEDLRNTLADRWPSLAKNESKSNAEPKEYCHSCLGMLQDEFLNSCVESITKNVKDQEYIYTNFKIMISQPIQLLLFGKLVYYQHRDAIYAHRRMASGLEIKDVIKIVIEPLLEKSLSSKAVVKGLGELDIFITIKHDESEINFLPQIEKRVPKCFEKAKKLNQHLAKKRPKMETTIFTLAGINQALEILRIKDLKEMVDNSYFCQPATIGKIRIVRAPVFLGGRYRKYSRVLSQTPWILDGTRKSEMSVEEFIAEPMKKYMRADANNFSSSGREDIDVRMLGNGRPFLVELINARRFTSSKDAIAELQVLINQTTDSISVQDLQIIDKDEVKNLKDGEEAKTKSYSSICYTVVPNSSNKLEFIQKIRELSSLKDLRIEQKTPLRVLHRRNLAVRSRVIYSLNAEVIDVTNAAKFVQIPSVVPEEYIFFELNMTTQAGTYVKEFVHGDFGRTIPNVGSLVGAETDILSLDVIAVNLDWPPSVEAL